MLCKENSSSNLNVSKNNTVKWQYILYLPTLWHKNTSAIYEIWIYNAFTDIKA